MKLQFGEPMRFLVFLMCLAALTGGQFWGIENAEAYMCMRPSGTNSLDGSRAGGGFYNPTYRDPSERVIFIGKLIKIKYGPFAVLAYWNMGGLFVYEVEEVLRGLRADPGDLVFLMIEEPVMKFDMRRPESKIGKRQIVMTDRKSVQACDGAWFGVIDGDEQIELEAHRLRLLPEYEAARTVKMKAGWIGKLYIKLDDDMEKRVLIILIIIILGFILWLSIIIVDWGIRLIFGPPKKQTKNT